MALKKIPKAPSGFIKKDDDQKKRGRGRGGRGRGKRPTKRPTKVPYTPGPAPDPPSPSPAPDGFKKRPPPIVSPPDRMKGGGPINAHKQEAMSPCPKPRVRGY